MSKIFSKSNQIMYLICSLLFLIIGTSIVYIPLGQAGFTLLILLGLVTLIALLAGRITALGCALLLFFVLGSTFFWISLSGSLLFIRSIPIELFLVWMTIVVFAVLLAGTIALRIREVYHQLLQERENVRALVAIDPVTEFDNKDRFDVELDLEFKCK